jgi:hypothetical protein
MKRFVVGLAVVVLAAAGDAKAVIVVGGNYNSNIQTALNDLGESFTLSPSLHPDPTGLGAGDIIIIGQDGGTGPFVDYNAFLNAGGDLIFTGGSNYDPFRTWAAGYFNITDTASGWHTDGDWHKTSDHAANSYLPDDYAFTESGHTFHMLAFLPTPNTTLLGRNDEPVYVAAIREYGGGGTFNYMALDLGRRPNDQSEFITPWLRGALEAAVIPEPSTLIIWCLLGGLGIGVGWWRRRRAA